MSRQQQQQKQTNSRDLMRYAGLSAQILVALGLAVFAGYKADKWLSVPIPILIWLLPLVVLFVMFYKLAKDTSNRKKGDDETKV